MSGSGMSVFMKKDLDLRSRGLGRAWWAGLMLCGLVQAPIVRAAGTGVECLIEPMQVVEVATSSSGQIARTMVSRGDKVRKGQVLAELDMRQEQAELASAQYRATQTGPMELAERKIKFAHQKYDRLKAMAADRLVAPQESDDAEGELRLAEGELKVAQENQQLARLEVQMHQARVGLRSIRSPIDGVVMEQMARTGELVEAGGTRPGVFRLAQIHPLRIHVVLSKDYFGKVKVGDTVMVDTEAPVAKQLKATAKSVDRLIDAASGTFVVILELPNADFSTPAGLRCRARI